MAASTLIPTMIPTAVPTSLVNASSDVSGSSSSSGMSAWSTTTTVNSQSLNSPGSWSSTTAAGAGSAGAMGFSVDNGLAILGIVLAGIVALLLFALLLWFCVKACRRQRDKAATFDYVIREQQQSLPTELVLNVAPMPIIPHSTSTMVFSAMNQPKCSCPLCRGSSPYYNVPAGRATAHSCGHYA